MVAMFERLTGIMRYILQNPSNEGQKLRRLGMAVGWQLWKRTVSLPLIVTLDNGYRFIAEPKSGNSVGVIYTRIYEPEYILFLRKHIAPGGSMVDVGAHTGLFTLLLAHALSAGVCFEPAPDTYELITDNFRLNRLEHFQLMNAAVGNREGHIGFYVQQEFGGGNKIDESAKLLVPLTTIDSHLAEHPLVPPISLIKIDVEGAELDVLEGARSTLAKNPSAMLIIENSNAEKISGFLSQFGWKAFAIGLKGTLLSDARSKADAYNLIACGPSHELYGTLAE